MASREGQLICCSKDTFVSFLLSHFPRISVKIKSIQLTCQCHSCQSLYVTDDVTVCHPLMLQIMSLSELFGSDMEDDEEDFRPSANAISDIESGEEMSPVTEVSLARGKAP